MISVSCCYDAVILSLPCIYLVSVAGMCEDCAHPNILDMLPQHSVTLPQIVYLKERRINFPMMPAIFVFFVQINLEEYG